MYNKENMKKLLAEFTGTALLVFFAIGIASMLGVLDGVYAGSIIGGALAFGLVLIVLIYVLGPVSGGHFNPAVSVAAWLSGKMTLKDMSKYCLAQFLGGLFGGVLLFGLMSLLGDDAMVTVGMGANAYTNILGDYVGRSIFIALLLETMLTFMFVFTILAVTRKENRHAGIIIGLCLIFVHLLGIPFTGTSVNPARSLGPAVFAGVEYLRQVWLFIVAPLFGAAAAAGLFKYFYGEKKEDEKTN